MTRYYDLPEWAWKLVAAVVKEEDEHGLYYVMDLDSGQYEQVKCPGRKMYATIPDEVITAVRVAQSWPRDEVDA